MGQDISKPIDGEVQLIGVNKKTGEQWDPSKSYMIEFRGKGEHYGRPVEGTKTAQRAEKAIKHINKQIINLLVVIRRIGETDPETNQTTITFGRLFEWYEPISDNLVGLLIRARRWRLLDFPGEMLYQRQDDNVVIMLLVTEADFVIDKQPSSSSNDQQETIENKNCMSNGTSSYESKLNVSLSRPELNNNNHDDKNRIGIKTGQGGY